MKIVELVTKDDVHPTAEYHDTLNPLLWNGMNLKSNVRQKLLEISDFFQECIDIPELKIVDVILTGSSSNFNWTRYSDIDLHLLATYENVKNIDMAKQLVETRKKIWNDTHTIKLYGMEVETYVQDVNEKHVSTAVFSIINDEWIVIPEHVPPSFDHEDVKVKLASWINNIESLKHVGCDDVDSINTLIDKLKRMRKSGLETAGEFSVENIVFKNLRNSGHIRMLYDAKTLATDSCFSLGR